MWKFSASGYRNSLCSSNINHVLSASQQLMRHFTVFKVEVFLLLLRNVCVCRVSDPPIALMARVPAVWPNSREWTNTSVLFSPPTNVNYKSKDLKKRMAQSDTEQTKKFESWHPKRKQKMRQQTSGREVRPQPGRAGLELVGQRSGSSTWPSQPRWAVAVHMDSRMSWTPSLRFAAKQNAAVKDEPRLQSDNYINKTLLADITSVT